MKKRLLSILLTLCMVMAMLPVTALAQDADSVTGDGLLTGNIGSGDPYDNFTVDNGILTGYSGPGEDILIPDGVITIGSDVFARCKDLMSVTVPDSVTSIKANAFANCRSLTDVYYGGDEAQWNAIDIAAEGNEALTSAAVHYASDGAQSSVTAMPPETVGGQTDATPGNIREEPALAALLEEYIQKKKINGNNISIAYYNTVSGGQYLWNSDQYFTAASIYKLPLNMYYYEMEAAGEISSDALFGGYKLSYCHKQSLQYSNNELSQAMRAGLGSYKEYKTKLAKYGGIPAEELPELYYSGNYFNTAFILNTLKILYDRSEFFSEAIGYLKDATPGRWFEKGVPNSMCTVAQKYGYLLSNRAYVHAAGIFYADEPFLLVVFTQDVGYAESVLGDIARICYDYTQANVGKWKNWVLDFTDVLKDVWYAEPVVYCAERGMINGTSGTTFSPNDAFTRAMTVTMLGRFFGVNGEGSFSDVNYGDYYSLYAEWAYKNGILEWMDGPNFAPNEPVTREQTAAMLYRCLVLQNLAPPDGGEGSEDFSDAGEISDYAKSAVDALRMCGIFQGDNAGCFNPQQSLTRAEAAALFMRLDQYAENRLSSAELGV